MITIRAIRPRQLRQVIDLLTTHLSDSPLQDLTAEACQEANQANPYQHLLHELTLLNLPLLTISHLLPPDIQFMPGLYVAASPEHVLGLIRLSRDGKKRNRWRIDEMIIDSGVSAYDVGSQLINYVINRYGGAGVQTFLAKVTSDQDQALGLFKSCGFRHCTRVNVYRHQEPASLFDPKETHLVKHSIKGMRPLSQRDMDKLLQLHRECLPTELRLSLEKDRQDFETSIADYLNHRLQGQMHMQFVVEDVARDVIMGWVQIQSTNYKHFQVSMLTHPGWPDLAYDLLDAALRKVVTTTRSAKVEIEVLDCHKDQITQLEAMGFERISSAELLVKDYWIPLQENKSRLRSPLLIFEGKTSPAVNFK